MADSDFTRPVSVRTRFEIFKRDGFTCQYCGRRSPDVVLEVDHIDPRCLGGSDDPVNLITSCWECNRGKAGVPLAQVMTGEDPHDAAIETLERQRQVEEYNRVMEDDRNERERQAWTLIQYWQTEQGVTADKDGNWWIDKRDFRWLANALRWCPPEVVRQFMDIALDKRMTKNFRYVAACCRNWRYEHQAKRDMKGDGSDSDY